MLASKNPVCYLPARLTAMQHPLDTKLNTAIIHDFFGDDMHHFENVLRDFLIEAPLFRKNLHELQPTDTDSVKKLMHRFKPLYYYVGLAKAFAQLEAFEKLLHAGDKTEVATYFGEAYQHLDHAVLLVEAELNRMRNLNDATHA